MHHWLRTIFVIHLSSNTFFNVTRNDDDDPLSNIANKWNPYRKNIMERRVPLQIGYYAIYRVSKQLLRRTLLECPPDLFEHSVS